MFVEIVILLIFILIIAIGVELTQKLKILRSNYTDNVSVIPQIVKKFDISEQYIHLAKQLIQQLPMAYDSNLNLTSSLQDVLNYQKATMASGLRDLIFEEALNKFIPTQDKTAKVFREYKKMFPYFAKYPSWFNTTTLYNMIISQMENDLEITLDYLLLDSLNIAGANALGPNVIANIKQAKSKKIITTSNYYTKNTLDDIISILPNGGFNIASTKPDDLSNLLNYLNLALVLPDTSFLTSLQMMNKYLDFQNVVFPLTDYDISVLTNARNGQFLASLFLKLLNKTAVPESTIANLLNIMSTTSDIHMKLTNPVPIDFNSALFPPNEIWTKENNQDLTNEDLITKKKFYSLKTYYPNENSFNLGTGLLACNATFLPFNFQVLTSLYTESNQMSLTEDLPLFNFVTRDKVPRHQSLHMDLSDKNYTLNNSNAGVLELSRGGHISFINTGASFDTEGAFRQYCYMDNEVQTFCVIVNTLSSPEANSSFVYMKISSLTIPDITASNINSIIVGTKVTLLRDTPFSIRVNNETLWFKTNTMCTGLIELDESTNIYTLTLSTTELKQYTITVGTSPVTFYMFSMGISDNGNNLATWSLLNYGTAKYVPTVIKPTGHFAVRVFLQDLHSDLYDNIQFVPYTITEEAKKRMILADDGGSLDLLYSPKTQNDSLTTVNNISINIEKDGNMLARNLRSKMAKI